MTVQKIYQQIDAYTQNPLGEMRVLDSCPVGKGGRQGDVYLYAIASFDPTHATLVEDRQLAPGTSSGSRHTVSDSVKVWKPSNFNTCENTPLGFKMVGYVVEADTRWTLMHPEHPDASVPAGTYQICYQVDPSTMQRVLD
jgi:hypothetical protein